MRSTASVLSLLGQRKNPIVEAPSLPFESADKENVDAVRTQTAVASGPESASAKK